MRNTTPTDRNQTFGISKFATWSEVAPDLLIARRGAEPICIECDSVLMGAILSGLETPRTVEELARRLEIGREELETYFEALLDAGLVTTTPARADEPPPRPFVESIVVVSHDPLGPEISRSMDTAEVGLEIHSIDPESCSGAAIDKSGRSWLDRLGRMLTNLERPLLVGAPTDASLEMLLEINRCCLRLEAVWLPVVFDGDSIRLGPTIIPHRTPCFGCLVEHEAAERRAISPEFPDEASLRTLRETWPLPTGGRVALQCIRGAADCASEAVALRSGELPRLGGRQRLLDVSGTDGEGLSDLVFSAFSRCTSCHGGARRAPTRGGKVSALPEAGLTLTGRPLQQSEGGLRTVRHEEARRRVVEAFARFGATFRVDRCRYGPLAGLPTYRSISTGYLDHDLPYLIPAKRHSGKGTTEEQAYLSAAYEMAERVSALFWGQKELICARPSEVGKTAIDLTACFGTRYLDVPGLDRVENDPHVDWVVGESLSTGRSVLVPASLVFHSNHVFRGRFDPGRSGGLAAGATIEDAILHGLFESVEHDGWAVWQANRVRCARVDPESVDSDEIRSWFREIMDHGLEVIIRDRRTDLEIPTFRVWLTDGTRPQVYASRGDGAHLDREIALRRALTEAQHKLAFDTPFAWRRILTHSPKKLLDQSLSVYFVSGLAPFELADDAPEVDFSRITGGSTGEVVGDIGEAVARITAAVPGSDVVVVDLTDPHLGIPTVRVVTVGLQRTGEPLCSVLPRLFDLPVRLGRRDRRLAYHELFNGSYPH